eukprot:RCo004101
MRGQESPSDYLRQTGVPYVLEQLLAATVAQQPAQPIQFMMHYLSKCQTLPSVKRRFTEPEMQQRIACIQQLFDGAEVGTVEGMPYATFRLTDFAPAMPPECVEDIADALVYHAPFDSCDVIIAPAVR